MQEDGGKEEEGGGERERAGEVRGGGMQYVCIGEVIKG